ncbi:hypothetical protein R84981_002895 [Carnimonas sp. R-84981]|uniref:hypothetical protein n=1 Tax=Carnimonas bestiolae TaxID=3402172 RepID=UPI003EDC8415
MALRQYGSAGANLTVFGITIDEWGESNPAITIEDLEYRATLKRGVGRSAVRLDNMTRPKRLTINLMPGSPQVRQILAAEKAGGDASFTFRQSGANEYFAGWDGVMTRRGQVQRAGRTTISDEQLIFEFNDSEET